MSDTPSTPETQLSNPITSEGESGAPRRQAGPKVVYILLAPGTDKSAVQDVHTNTRTLLEAMEATPGAQYVKKTLPQGEPRGPKRSNGV